MIASIVIDGAVKLIQKLTYKNTGEKKQENVIRIFEPRQPLPEKILYESKIMPGLYIDEVDDKLYTFNGKKLKQVPL